MRSSTFRNVALGILALAGAYCAGFQGASAQAPTFRVLHPGLAVLTAGQVFLFDGERGWQPASSLPPVPVNSIIAGAGMYLTEDGTAWRLDGYLGTWSAYPLPGSATSASRQSLGQVKARYH